MITSSPSPLPRRTGAAPETASQRARARARLPQAGGGEGGVTLRHHLERAAAKAAALQAATDVLLASGNSREAVNKAVDGFRAALAAERDRRPGEVRALDEYFISEIVQWVRKMPALTAVDEPEGGMR